jgi:hypothetical protein
MKTLALLPICIGFSFSASAATQRISFDEIKTACKNPAAFHSQVAPTNIQLSCKDAQFKWVASVDGSLEMARERSITTALVSDKYEVEAATYKVQVPTQKVGCTRFKQVLDTLETVRTLSCEEIVAIPGTSEEFCTSTLDTLILANPAGVVSKDTGKIMDLCSNVVESQNQQ